MCIWAGTDILIDIQEAELKPVAERALTLNMQCPTILCYL